MNRRTLLQPSPRTAEVLRTRFELNNLLSLALGAVFLGTGIAKVIATDFVVQTFPGTEIATAVLVGLGLLEILAAVLTLIPTTRLLGSGLIALIMTGALGYHLVRGEASLALVPLTALVAALTALRIELSLRRAEPAVALASRS